MFKGLDRRSQSPSLLAFCGGLLAAASIGVSAYAAHGIADAAVQSQLNTAALYAFGHGLALAALGRGQPRKLGQLGLCLLLLGTLLFSGSLMGGALLQWRTGLAPAGGMALMLGWLLLACNALRR